jgi:hypothetical protein
MKEWPGLAGMTRLVSNSGKKDKIRSEATSRASSQDQKTPSPRINNPSHQQNLQQAPPNPPLPQGPQPQYVPVQQSYSQNQIMLDSNMGGAPNNPGSIHPLPAPQYTQPPPAPHQHTLERKPSQQQLHGPTRRPSQQQLRHRPSQRELQPQHQPQHSQAHASQYVQSQSNIQTPPEFVNAHRALLEYYIDLPQTIRQKQQQIQASYPMPYSTAQEGREQHQRYHSSDGYANATQQQWNQQVSPQQPQPYTPSPYQDYPMYTDATLEPVQGQYANSTRIQHSSSVHTVHDGYYSSVSSSSGIMEMQAPHQDTRVQSYSGVPGGGLAPTPEEDSPDSNWNHLIHQLGVG